MTQEIKLADYQGFVESVASKPSTDLDYLTARLKELEENELGVNIPELMTSYTGLGSEVGEYTEIVKKILFQGKELNADNVYHMKRELGDVCWYLALACSALNTSLEEILVMNVEKLSARYPHGFEIIRSEVRKEGDI